jgi:hypothetical protein
MKGTFGTGKTLYYNSGMLVYQYTHGGWIMEAQK